MSAPTLDFIQVFNQCINAQIEPKNRTELEKLIPLLICSKKHYEEAAASNCFHNIPPPTVYSTEEEDLLKKVYKQRFAKFKSCGRDFYDKILASAPNEKCLLCGQGTATELDHYLPQTTYPDLSVLPINLIPVCSECNFKKREHIPTQYENCIFHPYFDNFENINWLNAQIIPNKIASVYFSIAPNIDDSLQKRLNFICTKLNLNKVWQLKYGSRLIEVAQSLKAHKYASGTELDACYVKAHTIYLKETARTFTDKVFYNALSESEWFINGGFEDID
jgi:hypothetical protein